MEHTRGLAVQILNDVSLCNDPKQKAEHLSQLTELLVRKEPGLLPEFLPEMVQLQVDPSPLVRKTYVVFLGQGTAAQPTVSSVSLAATSLLALLKDSSPLVLKEGVAACSHVVKMGLALFAAQPTDKDALAMWELVKQLQQQAISKLQSSSQAGVRLSAAKLTEQVVLLFSSDYAPVLQGAPVNKLPQAATLQAEAASALRTLLDVLRATTTQQPGGGPLLICAIKAAGVVATSRPALLGRVLPALLALAKEGDYFASESPRAGNDARGSHISIGNTLRYALCSVLRSRHPSSVPWRDRVVETLGAIGAEAAAEASLKYVARQDFKDHRANKLRAREAPGGTPPDAKKARTDAGPTFPTPASAATGAAASAPHTAAGGLLTGQPATGALSAFAGAHAALPGMTAAGPARTPTPPLHAFPPGTVLLPQQVAALQAAGLLPGMQQQLLPPPAGLPAATAAATQPPSTLQFAPTTPTPPLPSSLTPPPSLQALLPGLAQPLPAGLEQSGGTISISAQPPLTSPQELMQLHMMLPGLLAHPDPSLVPAFLDSLTQGAPAMLADLVMALMLTSPLPSLEEVTQRLEQENVTRSTPPPEAPTSTAGAVAPPSPKPVERGLVSKAPAVVATTAHGVPTLAAMARLLQRQVGSSANQRHLPPGFSAMPAELQPSSRGLVTASMKPPPRIAEDLKRGAPLVRPQHISTGGMLLLRTSAVTRVAACIAGLPAHARPLWQQLLPRLVACGSTILDHLEGEDTHMDASTQQQSADRVNEVALEYSLQAIAAGQGLELATSWLSALLAEQCSHTSVKPSTSPTLSVSKLTDVTQEAGTKDTRDGPNLPDAAAVVDGKSHAMATAAAAVTADTTVEAAGGDTAMAETAPMDVDTQPAEAAQNADQAPAADASQQPEQQQQQKLEADGADKAAESSVTSQTRQDAPLEVGAVQGSGAAGGARSLSLSGTRYEQALLALLERLSAAGMWTQLKALLSEAPALTHPGVTSLLSHLLTQGEDAASAALIAARDALLTVPAVREPMLQLVLHAAYDVEASTRSKAVRLCCNQLVSVLGGALAPRIMDAATRCLHALLHPPAECAARLGGELASAVSLPGAMRTRSSTGKDQVMQQAGHEDEDYEMEEAEMQPAVWSSEEAMRMCELYTTLCVRYPDMLMELMTTFAAAPPAVQAALMNSSEQLAKALGHSCSELVQLVRHPIKGAEPLLHHMLEVLMSYLLPSEAMLVACRERAMETGDVSILAPVIAALSKGEVLQLLPQLLQVPSINLRSLYKKLATHNGALGDPLFSPAELLVALNALDPRRDGVPPKVLIAAVDGALHAPDVFPQQAVAQALQQMEQQPVLPLLFMRVVITALKALPKLRKFIAELLARLISRQIWLDPGQWRGLLLLVDNTGKPFFHLMLQLPSAVLAKALGITPEGAPPLAPNEPKLTAEKAVQLATWATNPTENKTQVVQAVSVLFQRVLETNQAQQQQQEAAAANAAASAAAAAAAPAASEAQPVVTEQAAVADAALASKPSVGAAAVVPGTALAGEGGLPQAAQPGTEAQREAAGGEGGGEEAESEEEEAQGVQEGEAAQAGAEEQPAEREMDEFDLDFDALEEEAKEGEEEGAGEGDKAEDVVEDPMG